MKIIFTDTQIDRWPSKATSHRWSKLTTRSVNTLHKARKDKKLKATAMKMGNKTWYIVKKEDMIQWLQIPLLAD